MSLLRRFTLHPATSFIPFVPRLFPLLLLVLLFSLTLPGTATEPVPLPHTSTSSSGDEPPAPVYFQQSQLSVVPESGYVNNLAVSGDGRIALISAYNEQDDAIAIYIFSRSGITWTQQAILPVDHWSSLALNGDGTTALIGDRTSASVAVFTRSGTTWIQQATLTASDSAAEDYFGASVALSADGSAALIGAGYADVDGNVDQGAAYIFTRTGETWAQQAKLVASAGAAGDGFGGSVALSADGSTALMNAYHADVDGNVDQGAAYVFTRSGESWTQQAKLSASDGTAGDCFGSTLALSGDGSVALMSASGADVDGKVDQGEAYVFTRTDETWSQQAKLIASDGDVGDYLGSSVELSIDGSTAMVGAYDDDIDWYPDQGSIYVFRRNGESWVQQSRLTESQGNPVDHFGLTTAMSADGSIVLSYRRSSTFRQTTPGSDSGNSPKTNDPFGSVYIFQSGINLLTNGDFETDADSDQQPDGWTATALSGDKLRCNQPGKPVACGGQCAYVFKGEPGEMATLTQHLEGTGIDVGKGLVLTVNLMRVRVDAPAKILFKVHFANGERSKGKLNIPVGYSDPPTNFSDYHLLNSAVVPVTSTVEDIKVIVRYAFPHRKMFVDNLGLIAVDISDFPTTLPLPGN